jgi:hypothetical protein
MKYETEKSGAGTVSTKQDDTMELDIDEESSASEGEHDPFAGFDVAPEEKEFLQELLPHASQEERGLLQRARESDNYGGARRLSSFQDEHEFQEYTKNTVATEHPFWQSQKWSDDDMSEFEADVHEFAVAAGMGEDQADVEVVHAVGLWKSARGLKAAKPANIAVGTDNSSKKRKRDNNVKASDNTASVVKVTLDEDGTKLKKKQRTLDDAPGQVDASTKLNLKTSEEWYATPSEVTAGEPKNSDSSIPSKTEAPVPTGDSAPPTTNALKRSRRSKKRTKQGLTKSEHVLAPVDTAKILSNEPLEEAEFTLPADIAMKVEAARLAVESALKATPTATKRKKKRNHNKLPKEPIEMPVAASSTPKATVIADVGGETSQSRRTRRRKERRVKNESSENVFAGSPSSTRTDKLPVLSNGVINVSEPMEKGKSGDIELDERKPTVAKVTAPVNSTIEAAEVPNVSQVISDDKSSKKRQRDQETVAQIEAPVVEVAEPVAPRPKRPRQRISKAERQREQADIIAGKATVSAIDINATLNGDTHVKASAEPSHVPSVQTKASESKEGPPAAKDAGVLADILDTNLPTAKRKRKDRGRKSVTAIDKESQAQESKAHHL